MQHVNYIDNQGNPQTKVLLSTDEKIKYAQQLSLSTQEQASLVSWRSRVILNPAMLRSRIENGCLFMPAAHNNVSFVISWISHPELVYKATGALVELRMPPKNSSEYPRALIMAVNDEGNTLVH